MQQTERRNYTPRELMEIHVRTLFTTDQSSRLVNVNEPWPGSDPAPKFFLGRTTDGATVRRYRQDVPAMVVRELEELCAGEDTTALSSLPKHFATYMRLLQGEKHSMGPSYLIPDSVHPSIKVIRLTGEHIDLLKDGFQWLAAELQYVQPCVAVVIDGKAVCVCRSVRITAQAHEAGIETLEAFRGKGLAAATLSGWAEAVRGTGCLPMYSTSWENMASQAVAKKAGLVLYGSTFSIG